MERNIVRLDMDRDFEAFEELSVISFGENTNGKKEMYEWLFNKNPYNKTGNMMYLLKCKELFRQRFRYSHYLLQQDLKYPVPAPYSEYPECRDR